jgi:hypothetical protein
MNIRLATLAVALMAVSAPALAGDPCKQLARETGLTERQVKMVIGDRTPFAEYRTQYSRSVATLRSAIGDWRYDELMNNKRLADASMDTKASALLVALEENRNSNRNTP